MARRMPRMYNALAVVGVVGALALGGVGVWVGTGTNNLTAPVFAPTSPYADGVSGAEGAPGADGVTSPDDTAPPASEEYVSNLDGADLSALSGRTIVLDPASSQAAAVNQSAINAQVSDGRGGTAACDVVGDVSRFGYSEQAFAWAVADQVRTVLEENGATVILTREQAGLGPCVDARAAAASSADLLVSIGAGSDTQPGFLIMTVANPLNGAQGTPSQRLATSLAGTLQQAGFTENLSAGASVRDDVALLNLATVPAVVVDLAQFGNADDSAAAADPAVQTRYVEALVLGIAQSF